MYFAYRLPSLIPFMMEMSFIVSDSMAEDFFAFYETSRLLSSREKKEGPESKEEMKYDS